MNNYPGNIIFSSHDAELLDTVANRIIRINLDGTYIDRLMSYEEFVKIEEEE